MFIFNANAFARNPAAAQKAVEELIESADGEILASRLWNEQKLAFPIKGHRKGAYWLTYARVESTRLAKLNRSTQLNDSILRHLFVKLEPRLVAPMVAVAKGEVPVVEEEAPAETPAAEAEAKPEAAAAE
jgi:small subunit ribosomal protein S6